uniref:Uncharacterized protein n=1 Tax=Anopheles coluzzii TaxID=1518534 RepID=A0A6E8VZT2_ANOCL
MNTAPVTKLKHKEWRKLFKKKRRKAVRQKTAQERDRQNAEKEKQKLSCPEYQLYLAEKGRQEQIAAEREELERALRHAVWLEEERKAQAKFEKVRQEEEAKEREAREKREKIRKEYEERETKLKQAKEERFQQQEHARRMLHERFIKLQEFAATGADDYLSELQSIQHTRADAEDCKFFLKTGACRHGYRCGGNHPTPGVSQVILIPNFFSHPALEQAVHAEYGHDARLEFDEDDLKNSYNEFFRDIIQEFEMFGTVRHIFVCRNSVAHLRGSVYIEYESMRNAAAAYLRMNGRFYAKKQLHVEFRNTLTWPTAVCGLNEMNRCQKGAGCNFLHILKNPDHRYVYNHFLESRSVRKDELLHLATPLLQKSWDEITSHSGSQTPRNAAQWRWSESPELEPKTSDHGERERPKKHDNERNEAHTSGESRRRPSCSSGRNRRYRSGSESGSPVSHRRRSGSRVRSQTRKHEHRSHDYASKKRSDDVRDKSNVRKRHGRSDDHSPLRSRAEKRNKTKRD